MNPVYDLRVYQLSEELSDLVWQDFDTWPEKAQRTVGYQVIRAADSIAANIAEGYGRYTPPDRRKFYFYARGSFEETKAWLRKCIRRKLVGETRAQSYKAVVDELGLVLNGFIKATKLPPEPLNF